MAVTPSGETLTHKYTDMSIHANNTHWGVISV